MYYLRPGHFARECPEGDGKGKFLVDICPSGFGSCANADSCTCAQAVDLAQVATLVAVVALGQEGTEMEVTFLIKRQLWLIRVSDYS